jgi:hypothetical protein
VYQGSGRSGGSLAAGAFVGTLTWETFAGAETASTVFTVNPVVAVAVLPFVMTGDTKQEYPQGFSYIVYIKRHPSGMIYVGRSEGKGTPEQVLKARDSGHHMNQKGYCPAEIHSRLTNAKPNSLYHSALRGREQQVLDFFGGVENTGNSRRAVWINNPAGFTYWSLSNTFFGTLAPFTGNVKTDLFLKLGINF